MNRIVIVGQTNVGKSRLFNSLTGKNLSIVFDGEDTTVDYLSLTVGDKLIIDTAGANSVDDIREGDLYLYVVKATKPKDDRDKTMVSQLKRRGKPVWLVVNGIDGKIQINERDCKSFGCERIYYVSAEHGTGIEDLKRDIGLQDSVEFNPTIAILGRCNSGKSTLMNCLLRQKRMIVSSKMGTTRDTVREVIKIKEQNFDFMDTAGYRNNSNILEFLTAKRRSNCLNHCVGSVVLINGEEGFTNLDRAIFQEAFTTTNFVVVAVNKKDKMHETLGLNTIPKWVPVVYVSALNNKIENLRSLILKAYEASKTKIKTNKLNRWLQSIEFKMRSPENRPVRLKYVTQFKSEPITIGIDKPLGGASIKQFSKSLAETFDLLGSRIVLEIMNS